MITIVKVPKKEPYYFCKKMFFNKFGDACMTFANCLEQTGFVGYPYYEHDDEDVVLLYIIYNINKFFRSIDNISNFKYSVIIVTDSDIKPIIETSDKLSIYVQEEFIEARVVDISDLESYYQVELDIDKFISSILLIDKITDDENIEEFVDKIISDDESATSH